MNSVDMNGVLAQLRELAARANNGKVGSETAAKQADFSDVLQTMLGEVGKTQMQAAAQAKSFEKGESGVDLAEVMITQEKARLAFQGTLQVRNKLVSAYQEIMNMQL